MDDLEQKQTEDESCGDECVIDLSKLKGRPRAEGDGNGKATLIIVTRGTYGHHDDSFSALQVGNAVLAVEEPATLLLLDDGVYLAVKGQDPSSLGLPNNIRYVEDFLDLGGRIIALESSLKRRGLEREDLVEGVEIIAQPQMAREVARHRVSVTF
jgi:sulfur relay (sulfurtransferase) DsrF/TusC family protein